MHPPVDRTRLQATLGGPELARLLDALQRRIERGRPLTGTLTISASTSAEREAIDALFGRKSRPGSTLSVNLDELAAVLRDAAICDNLSLAVTTLRGAIENRRGATEALNLAWAEMWREACAMLASFPLLAPWLAKLERLGVLRRLSGDRPALAATWLRDVATVAGALPAAAEPLPVFSARLFGDAHALDPGSARATLAVRVAALLGATPLVNDAEGRRAAWASVGVMCDELSTPALVLNLPSAAGTPLGRMLRVAAEAGEPLHVSLRLLLRHPLSADSALRDARVFICENPTIVALACARFGSRCAPLVCVNGQFATPSLVLLRQLRQAGAHLFYHGDFDPAGLTIARRAMAESGAKPWRFEAADYLAAPKGSPIAENLGDTPWDPMLSPAMRSTGKIVHEEAVFATLAEDLAPPD